MSVTFSIKGAPTERTCPYPDVDPYFWLDTPIEGYYELNVSNMNASAILESLQRYTDAQSLVGEWDQNTIDKILRRAIFIRNVKQQALKLEILTVQEGNFIVCGRNQEYVHTRLDQMIKLLQAAQEHKMNVIFA